MTINPAYLGDEFEAPGNTPIIRKQQRILQQNQQSVENIKLQYEQLYNLGTNFLDEYVTPEDLLEMLNYINNEYIAIDMLPNISEDPQKIEIVGTFVYELLFVDLINKILPLTEEDTLLASLGELKNELLVVINNVLTVMSNLNNDNLTRELHKYSLALELFDNDLEMFMENYLMIILYRYSSIINATRLTNGRNP